MKTETKEKAISIGKDILITVGILGLVTIAAASGNLIQLLKYTPLAGKRKYRNYQINKSIKNLLDRGLLKTTEDKYNKYLEVSDKGRKLLLKYELESLVKEKPKKWDKKYRVVIFDISEKRKKVRDHLRRMLKGFGFLCLQDSVWIYPYDCQEIIELLKKYLDLRQEVIYMTVDSIENDEWLLTNFGLKK